MFPEQDAAVDPEVLRKYVERQGGGCFADTRPSESKRRLPDAIDNNASERAARDAACSALADACCQFCGFARKSAIRSVSDRPTAVRGTDTYQVAFRKKLYESLEALQADLD